MIPLGYMYKEAAKPIDGLHGMFDEFCSVSHCIRPDFCDFYESNLHNAHYFFDHARVMHQIAADLDISLQGLDLFYYEAFEKQWDEENKTWESFQARLTKVHTPTDATCLGYDVVSYYYEVGAGCSPLTCNGLAKDFDLNRSCLFDTFEQAFDALGQNRFVECEPGPFRILAVNKVS